MLQRFTVADPYMTVAEIRAQEIKQEIGTVNPCDGCDADAAVEDGDEKALGYADQRA